MLSEFEIPEDLTTHIIREKATPQLRHEILYNKKFNQLI